MHAQEANYAPPIVVRFAHFTTIGSAPLSPVMQALDEETFAWITSRMELWDGGGIDLGV